MKKVVILIALVTTLISCNKTTKSEGVESTSTENNMSDTQKDQLFACPMHPEVTGKKGENCSKCGMELTEPVAQAKSEHNHNDGLHEHKDTTKLKTNEAEKKVVEAEIAKSPFSIKEIVTNYLKIKNALTKDDAKTAAIAGNSLFKVMASTNTNALTPSQKKEYIDIVDDAKEHAEHIGKNAGKIDHQREHFAILSKDINDLIKMFGTDQKLYQDYCPMYNDGKGALWISETKEIKNPFYGSQMLTCGSLKKTL
ncbi:DUF3347 domain-containing protein [Flavobacterium lacisediminis]|uniref:DUF3347 domain-containing protein n=1 Tax=Flavobacterium lacisediminis TaxID=2989705 RepID=A0ABT3EJN0_9FLAO|nr:DUF3347 domain-containing protein [Flavobacterium lacisediminis]MCW1148334.1 DUF3347 domain-containing protein [Flavobacterium lacisediminis]